MSLPPLVNLELYRGDDAEPIVLRVRGNAWDLTAVPQKRNGGGLFTTKKIPSGSLSNQF